MTEKPLDIPDFINVLERVATVRTGISLSQRPEP